MSEATKGLRLYNTLTRTKEDFVPIDPGNVRMYVCGPTVYDFAHIGNARPVIVFDVLYRLLRHLYGEDHVTYVRNITDVDDKINARAARDYPGLPLNEAIRKVTEETNAQFQADVKALGCLEPTFQPRATEHIDEMKAMIERLVDLGVAYVAESHVLFSPSAMNARPKGPRYGALARRSLDEMLAGARVDVASYKRDEMDFVLWKPSKPGEPGWPSPAGIEGLGRPGWHIECSAMSMAKLLEPFGGGLKCDDPQKNVFDIHAGGIDLVFPHHENEIAQSCCAFGSERMANIWMHNGFLQVEGKKMAKSEGNFVTINELLNTEKFGGRSGRRGAAACDADDALQRADRFQRAEAWEAAERCCAGTARSATTGWLEFLVRRTFSMRLYGRSRTLRAIAVMHALARQVTNGRSRRAKSSMRDHAGRYACSARNFCGLLTSEGALDELRIRDIRGCGRQEARSMRRLVDAPSCFIGDKNWAEADRDPR